MSRICQLTTKLSHNKSVNLLVLASSTKKIISSSSWKIFLTLCRKIFVWSGGGVVMIIHGKVSTSLGTLTTTCWVQSWVPGASDQRKHEWSSVSSGQWTILQTIWESEPDQICWGRWPGPADLRQLSISGKIIFNLRAHHLRHLQTAGKYFDETCFSSISHQMMVYKSIRLGRLSVCLE